MRLDALAQRVGGELAGDPGLEVHQVAPPEDARPGTVVVVTDPRRLRQVEAAGAAVILPHDAPPTRLPAIRVASVRLALALALRALAPRTAPPAGIHPTCVRGARVTVGAECSLGPYVVVGNDVTLGDRVQAHAHVVIEDDVQIGPDSILHAQATIRRGSRLGARVVVQSGAVVGSDGFGYAQDAERRHIHIPQIGRVVIEDDVEIGANTTVDRAMLGVTRIGRGTKLDNLVHIAHNVQIGEDVAIAAAVFVAGSARIGNRVLIGGWVGVRDHAVIGDDAIVHADTGVSEDVAPGDVVAGHPAWPARSQRRAEAAYRRLPELVRGFRELTRRLRRLEGG
ncbi:MAG: UDP-3-O-(3-hydroxymyristoyl)glucosamine N-acyltransferase [Bacillati bacterium ANGP1]|uniref:UDP-3-O-acylglucosamine N-acyltransferase n=1 Tax=Candidatus Segetimicrobium genomatis TaxID=2569760 RepID=A0A537K4U9_9BACT|nr:MAG: UDP-3-O-(3-hydroxymyristoyl)glucosamine N-acyltransferase [Terrabacteria group bacterium ANGP1]